MMDVARRGKCRHIPERWPLRISQTFPSPSRNHGTAREKARYIEPYAGCSCGRDSVAAICAMSGESVTFGPPGTQNRHLKRRAVSLRRRRHRRLKRQMIFQSASQHSVAHARWAAQGRARGLISQAAQPAFAVRRPNRNLIFEKNHMANAAASAANIHKR